MRKARIALVGAGWWATTTHLPALLDHPQADIAAVCDLDTAKARTAADVFGIDSIYGDFETMLERETFDGVMVATHHAAHYPVAKACLERGRHVFIEKPMTLRAKHARALVDLANSEDRQIVMGYNSNHSALAIRARDVVRSGELGAVQLINGMFSQHIQPLLAGEDVVHDARLHGPGDVYGDPVRSGGGHGHLQITHLAGMAFFITGLRIARVRGLMAHHGLAVDLAVAILAELDGGALANLGGTGNLPGGGRSFSLTVTCERGWIEFDEAYGRLIIRREGEEPERYEADGLPLTPRPPLPQGERGSSHGAESPQGERGSSHGAESPQGERGSSHGAESPQGERGSSHGAESPQGERGSSHGAESPEGEHAGRVDSDRGHPQELREGSNLLADSHRKLVFAPTQNFVDVILGQGENKSDGLIGWRAVELLDAAYRSAAQGGAAVSRDELYMEKPS